MPTSIPPLQDPAAAGREMHALAADLFPICRSITGNGVRETLKRLSALAPMSIREVPTGAPLLDWTAPKEWTIRDAWIKDPSGRKIVDFRASNLHVAGYSIPVRRKIPLAELQQHLHSLPDHPDWIPYRTNYYGEDWGFCLAHRVRSALADGTYEVCIDSTLDAGSLTYGELVLPGAGPGEILVTAHVCHPSLADDNLSGLVVAAFLARHLKDTERRLTLRFLFIPGTIGSIAWLALNETAVSRVRHGLVLACVGDAAPFTYKRSRRGDAPVDRAVAHLLKHRPGGGRLVDFSPYGYDERQFNSPGFNLPVGCLMRSMYGTFPEYHTSADNLDFVKPTSLAESAGLVLDVLDVLENNRRFLNLNPKGEPQLGRRGLYSWIGGQNDKAAAQMALLWVLNLSDGRHSLLDIAERADLPFPAIRNAAAQLQERGLLNEVEEA
ncbi:MAG TPA: DUF4910 domain-containing protein [Kiritimatiellia bacterium]|nr:DUF4910 domain-containing protein [Kiritimatiellia bacterium]HRZ12158.1 DUF4910 domain-containing protein [Kiritimatiellia bacterium]HSA18084.1 DUF4910 domain-containing protein [Kiritimatiellia bacterium]